jgi:4-amino-4-deoxy-L-arabinose transferase-like glycosyltransferase
VCYFLRKAFSRSRREAEIGNALQAGQELSKTAKKCDLSGIKVRHLRSIENWIVIATLVAFAVAAWWHIRSITIWYDEAVTMLTTSRHAVPDWSIGMQQFKPSADLFKIFSDLYNHDVHPPLYFWTLAIWRVLFGGSLEVARALSALFVLATLALLYRYAIEMGIRWPSVPVVIFALSAAAMRYAYNARPYAMATFLIVLTLYLAHRKSKWTGICAVSCVATHYFAAFCVGPILAIECLLYWKTDRRWVLWTGLSFATICAPLTVLVAHHMRLSGHQYYGFGSFPTEVHALLKGAVEGALPSPELWPYWRHWRHWNLALYVAALFVIAGGIFSVRGKQFTPSFGYITFLCAFLLTAIATNKSIMEMPNEYYLGIGVPLLVLLISYGVNAIPLASPLLAIALIAGTVTSTATPMGATPDYRSMVRQIRSECDHCAVLVGLGWGRAIPACVLYEANGQDVYQLQATDTPDEVVQRIGTRRPIYLIPANEGFTIEIEKQLVRTFASVPGDGYFKIDTTTPHNP